MLALAWPLLPSDDETEQWLCRLDLGPLGAKLWRLIDEVDRETAHAMADPWREALRASLHIAAQLRTYLIGGAGATRCSSGSGRS
jgi:hypothetical protein